MAVELYQVDAFASEPFKGNPAAVCLLPEAGDEFWMQQVAAEMNLSETAFLHAVKGGWSLRWFTPALEVDLCGHGTLAAAHVLFEMGLVSTGRSAAFETKSGLLTAHQEAEDIRLDFPARPAETCAIPGGLGAALGAKACWCGQTEDMLLVELSDARSVREVVPDFGVLAELPHRATCVTAASDVAEFDFVSRFFAPQEGILEDPVTGSAHCSLGPYWAAKLGRDELTGFQASRRGGVVRVRLAGDRVDLLGHAVTVMRGELVV
jgi:predicted PhzF superfamily epimerase YddE/YHI9